jgi:hypothetical protein
MLTDGLHIDPAALVDPEVPVDLKAIYDRQAGLA